MTSPLHGTILFGHGSRDPLWHRPMQAVAERAAALAPDTRVACAYLELTEPDLPTCTRAMVDAGVRRIRIVPMFLGVGRHAREDLPEILSGLRSAHPDITFDLQPSVGENDHVIDLLARLSVQSP